MTRKNFYRVELGRGAAVITRMDTRDVLAMAREIAGRPVRNLREAWDIIRDSETDQANEIEWGIKRARELVADWFSLYGAEPEVIYRR